MCTEMEEPHDDAVCIRRRHTVPASWPRHSSTVTSPDASLLIIVDEYSSMEQRDSDYVVVLTHGTSFSKDFWKPIIEFWFRPNSGMRASKVLALDAVNHGDSALANKQYLGEQDLFAQVILVEPILFQMDEQTEQIARLAMKRRDSWASLSDVVKFFKTSRSLSTWDEGQIERYAQVGTYEVVLNGHKSYLLKTSKNQEAPFPHILESLQECKVTQSFILGRNSIVLNQNHRARLMQMTTGDFFILEDVGHLDYSWSLNCPNLTDGTTIVRGQNPVAYEYITEDAFKLHLLVKQVAPAESEAILLSHTGVKDADVKDQYVDERASDVPVEFITTDITGNRLQSLVEELHKLVDSKVARYKCLTGGLFIIDEIPRKYHTRITSMLVRHNCDVEADIALQCLRKDLATNAASNACIGRSRE
ncbi:hypothetical protein BM1_07823 [Bipolaris maydis]|nr:hypothetical protein BM1_07823 [Bipolaris maydis]